MIARDKPMTTERLLALVNYTYLLLVMFVIAVLGALYFFIARPDRGVRHHVHDDLEPSGSER